ncbi:MAG: electron transfer flavoprotein subunit alpha/FixB family protein [bacterium]
MAEEILSVALPGADVFDPVSFEVAAFAKQWGQALDAPVYAVVLQAPAGNAPEKLAKETGLPVVSVEHEYLEPYNADAWVRALHLLMQERGACRVLIPHTATGWDFAPRLAVRAGASCSTAVTGFQPDDPEGLCRRICGGKLKVVVKPALDKSRVVTVMPGAAKPEEAAGAGEVQTYVPRLEKPASRNLGLFRRAKGELDLGRAEVIVAAGRGLGGPEHLDAVKELAACFDRGAVGASRPVVDAGWLPLEHQVGQTGQTVRPKLYLALGISGAVQHTTGMKESDLIVAVNKDPKAPIFNIAHLGVTKDLHEFLPVLTRKLKEKKDGK